ncbi:MAG TPA: fasciclin domain-containing protein [Vicinamibacterales bacterium]|nr:fasciclin domain-containing protein [Vicinamibacterales bacterium]
MKKFAGFLSVAVLSFTVVGCSDSMSPAAPTSVASDSGISSGSDEAKGGRAALPTIAGTAVAGGFNTLVYALGKAGLVETFDGSRQFTVFAPTDAAFGAAAASLKFANGQALVDYLDDMGLLAQVLTYHVTVGDRRAQGVLSSGQVMMLDGNVAAVTVDAEGAKIAGALIEKTDIIASNGIIHVLGGVMLPPGFGE